MERQKKKESKNYRTHQFLISKNEPIFHYFKELCHQSNDLYNATLFHIRQFWTVSKRKETELHDLQKQVLSGWEKYFKKMNEHNEIQYVKVLKKHYEAEEKTEKEPKLIKTWLPSSSAYPPYEALELFFKLSNCEAYRAMPSQVNQGVMKKAYENMNSFFKSLKAYEAKKESFTGRPKPPRYKHSGGEHEVVFSNQTCKLLPCETRLRFPKMKETFYIGDLWKKTLEKHQIAQVKEIRVQKWYHQYKLEIVYDTKNEEMKIPKEHQNILAIDLGVDRFATCVTNTGIEPIAIDGRPLKYQNQWYNKQKAYYQERLRNGLAPNKGKWISKQLQSLDSLRNSRFKDYYHQATAHIINIAAEEKISLILIGQNTGWKQNVKLKKRTKQNFAFLSHEMFISLMTYKANEKGIEVRVVEESYTSKASFLDCDDIPIYDKENKKKHHFSGKRLGRGFRNLHFS